MALWLCRFVAQKVFGVNQTLKKLNVDKNSLGKAMKAFGESLAKNPPLNHLDLSRCKLKDDGVLMLTTGLVANNTLEWLDLSRNGIKEAGAEQIGQYLRTNYSLTSMDLSKNSIGVGAKNIADGLEDNTKLTAIFLDHIGSGDSRQINALLSRNKQLKLEAELLAFQEILKDNSVTGKLMRSKLMLVGPGNVGKTATVRSLLSLPFKKEWESTIGASLMQAHSLENSGWSNREKERDLTTEFAAQVAHERLKEKRKRETPTFLPAPPQATPEEVRPINVIGGTPRNDDEEQEVGEIEDEVAERFDEALITEAGYTEESISFSIYDYGGQKVFYNFHHLFLTKYGVYLVVFDMRKFVSEDPVDEKDQLSSLKFWLNAIKLHAPDAPILLVGTYMDAVRERSLKGVQEILLKTSKLWPKGVVENVADNLSFFPVSNSLNIGIHRLRDTIQAVTKDQEYLKREVPLRWIRCLDDLLRGDEHFMTLEEVKTLGRKYGIDSGFEITQLLFVFHELGLLLYFKQTKTLAQLVTINPQWLISAVSRVIRDGKIHKYSTEKLKRRGLDEDVEMLLRNGITSRKLLKYLWRDSGRYEFLLDFMKQTLLLTDLPPNVTPIADRNAFFLIPSMVTDGSSASYASSNGRCVLRFPLIPVGLFERIVCLAVAFSIHSGVEGKAPELDKLKATIQFFKDCPVELEQFEDDNVITFKVENESLASNCLSVFLSMMRKIKTDIMGDGFNWEALFEHEDKLITFEEARSQSLEPYFKEGRLEMPNTTNLDVDEFIDAVSSL